LGVLPLGDGFVVEGKALAVDRAPGVVDTGGLGSPRSALLVKAAGNIRGKKTIILSWASW